MEFDALPNFVSPARAYLSPFILGTPRLTLTSDRWPVYILNGVTRSELHNRAVLSLLPVAK